MRCVTPFYVMTHRGLLFRESLLRHVFKQIVDDVVFGSVLLVRHFFESFECFYRQFQADRDVSAVGHFLSPGAGSCSAALLFRCLFRIHVALIG